MEWCWIWKMFELGLSEKKGIAWLCGLGVYRFDSDQDMVWEEVEGLVEWRNPALVAVGGW
jgi:hypothetical protein